MIIKITGINGYLGTSIAKSLRELGHLVEGINRNLLYAEYSLLAENIRGCDVIINLAGAPVFQRWTPTSKREIYDSRIKTTRNLAAAIASLPPQQRPKKFISASAIGIYKAGLLHDENSSAFDTGFLGKVVQDWENALDRLPAEIQKNVFRIGLVLGKHAKIISSQRLPFKLGLGAKIGNGKQAFPFIHEMDLVRAFVWAATKYSASNTFNLVAPQSINNAAFTKSFARQLGRSAIFTIPAFALKLPLGEAASLLTQSPAVSSAKIIGAGFQFQFPDIRSALHEILR